MTDVIIIGGGPAGVSAALTLKSRNKSVLVISNSYESSNLWKAKTIENYPGMQDVSGADVLKALHNQLENAEISVVQGRALNAMPVGDGWYVSVGQDYYETRSVIMATGVVQQSTYLGEQELLGKGVSYCATCDGMLYRGKKIAVIGLSDEAEEETEFLRSINCDVEFFDKNRAKKFEIKGENSVESIIADGIEYPVEGVFILRNTIAPSNFINGLKSEGGHIIVDNDMKTDVDGVYACGDCIGRPYQVARSVGQGNTAALSVSKYLDGLNK